MPRFKWLGILLPLCFLGACTQTPSFADSRSQPQTAPKAEPKAAPTSQQNWNWSDRRPIGTMFLGNSPAYTPNNPRKWLIAKDLNLSTPGGQREFKERMLGLARGSVKNMKSINAQGVIVFDLEGIEIPDNRTWVGDPRLLKERAPEMDEIADEFFKVFQDAGLRVGVTIRGQYMFPYKAPLPPQWWKTDKDTARYWSFKTQEDAVETISKRIAYAKQRWGATLFYIDSNNDKWSDVIARLQQRFPDSLIIPEHTQNDPTYFGFSAPLERVDYQRNDFDRENRKQYPDGFKAILLRDPDTFEERFKVPLYDYLLPKVQAGDLLMINVWYPNKRFEEVRKLYREVYGDRCCTWTANRRRS